MVDHPDRKPTWQGILKVQRELAPSRDSTVLFTDQSGSIYFMLPMHRAVLSLLGTDLKMYAFCRLWPAAGETENCEIVRRTRDRSW